MPLSPEGDVKTVGYKMIKVNLWLRVSSGKRG
jgi:hypothetical protein